MNQRNIYIVVAVVGLILPWWHYVPFIAAEGLNLPLFIQGIFANGPATGFTLDVLWSTFVFWAWSFYDAKHNDIKGWWLILLSGSLVGLSVSMPLYFAMRVHQLSNSSVPTKQIG